MRRKTRLSIASTTTAAPRSARRTCLAVITFNNAYGTAPKSILPTAGTNVNSGATTRTAAVTAIGTGSFTVVMSGTATVASTAYTWYYWVIQ